jgi:hypothetical protein
VAFSLRVRRGARRRGDARRAAEQLRQEKAPRRAREDRCAGFIRIPLYAFDQVDFLVGGWLVVAVVVAPTATRLLWSAAFVLVVHPAISIAGAALGMRASAR